MYKFHAESGSQAARQHVLTKIVQTPMPDADLPGKANSTPPEPKRDKPKKKRYRKRQWTPDETHKAHTEMCGKAVKMMSKIERMLDKFKSESSDEE